MILTLGAPIRTPRQALAALTEAIAHRLASGAVDVEERMDIRGNRVRFRVLGDGSAWTSRAIGFVFSGEASPGDLADAFASLRDTIAAQAAICTPDRFAGDWWLVLTGDRRIADVGTYRRAFSRLSLARRFETILMMFRGGRIDVLER